MEDKRQRFLEQIDICISLQIEDEVLNFLNKLKDYDFIYEGQDEGDMFNSDHIYPANRGGLTIPDNMVLICSPCNLSKSADSLKSFTKRNHLDYDEIVTRLEVMGKYI